MNPATDPASLLCPPSTVDSSVIMPLGSVLVILAFVVPTIFLVVECRKGKGSRAGQGGGVPRMQSRGGNSSFGGEMGRRFMERMD